MRSVRFSDTPQVAPQKSDLESPVRGAKPLFVQPPPRVHDDILYDKCDIFTAASIGDAELVEAQLQSGFDPNRPNKSGWTALMYATYLGHENVCNVLLKYGSSVDIPNLTGDTALMLAASCGSLPVLKLLLRKGAEVDKKDLGGGTALAHAVCCSQTVAAETLLDAGADPDAPDNEGMTPTLVACAIGHELTLLAVLQKGGNPKLKNNRGEDGEALAFDNPKAISILRDPPKVTGKALQNKEPNGTKSDDMESKGAEVETLPELLRLLKLEKYVATFEAENVDLNVFLKLTDSELCEIGVKAFGPRKKMLTAISRFHTEGTFLPTPDPSFVDNDRQNLERRSKLVTNELIECQQQLAQCEQKLREARRLAGEQQKLLDDLREASDYSRTVAFSLLKDMRRHKGYAPFEKEIMAIIGSIDRISMKMLELPRL